MTFVRAWNFGTQVAITNSAKARHRLCTRIYVLCSVVLDPHGERLDRPEIVKDVKVVKVYSVLTSR